GFIELIVRLQIVDEVARCLRYSRGREVIEMMKKPDPRSSAVPEVVEKEELDVLVETREQREEVGVSLQCGRQWARVTTIVTPDALKREVDAVGDARVESTGAVDCGSTIDAIARKDDRTADRVTEIRW